MSEKILLIEDDAALAQMGVMFLKRVGYDVRSAQTGHDALDIIQSWYPDLFLIDLMMPDINGLELIETLRMMPEFKTTPIIIVSALSQIEIKAKGYLKGADDYITKPYTKEELTLRIHALLRRAKMPPPGSEINRRTPNNGAPASSKPVS